MPNDEHNGFKQYMKEQRKAERASRTSKPRLRQTVQGPKEHKPFAMTLCIGNAIGRVQVG